MYKKCFDLMKWHFFMLFSYYSKTEVLKKKYQRDIYFEDVIVFVKSICLSEYYEVIYIIVEITRRSF